MEDEPSKPPSKSVTLTFFIKPPIKLLSASLDVLLPALFPSKLIRSGAAAESTDDVVSASVFAAFEIDFVVDAVLEPSKC